VEVAVGRDIAAKLGLPPVDQVGFVVRDLDRAIETFGAVFGEFHTMETALEGAWYRGRRADVTLRIGFGKSGPLEIELIEVVSGESPHREMLEKHGEGVHHIRFRVDDIDPPLEQLKQLGFEVIWSHEIPQVAAKWAYLEAPPDQGGALIELYSLGARAQ
jgi:methylmalonyl-CoA/ethylmalonyl-CoA epimerase